jgi:heme-degrading monooxygenase HmoA
MQKILIDTFVVPEEFKSAFLEQVRKSASFLRTIPGYVEGYIYEKTGGESAYNVVTTAVWESEEAFINAREAALAGFKKIGFNPQQIITDLNVTMQRAVYEREPY